MYESEHFESPVKVPSYSLLVSKANAFRIIDNNLGLIHELKPFSKGREHHPMGYLEEKHRLELNQTKRLVNAVVYSDRIVICGQTIKRPSGIAPSQWLSIWESLAA